MFNENQIHEIEAHGLTVAQVEEQKEGFEKTPTMKIKRFLYRRDK